MASAKDVALYFGGTLLTQAITFVTGISVARWIGPSAYGTLSLARNVYQALAIIAPLGLDLSLLRHLGENGDDWAGSFAQVSRLRLLAAIVNSLVLAVTVIFVAPLLQLYVYHTPHFALYLDLTLSALPFAADIAILTACLRALGSVDLQNIASLYLQPVVRMIALIVLVLIGLGVAGVAVSTTFGAAAACGIMTLAVRQARRRREILPRVLTLEDRAAIRRVLGYSGWLAVMMFLYNFLRNVDVLVLGRFRSTAEVGEYAALSTIAFTIQIFPFALGQTLAPTVARSYAQGDLAAMRATLSDYLRKAVLLTSPLFAGVAVFGPWLDLLFGSKYHFSSSLSLNLAVAYMISGALGQMGVSLTMTGRHRQEFAVLVVGTGLAVAACVLLAPRYGGNGVAIGITLGYLFTNGVRTFLSARFMGGLDISLGHLGPPLVCLVLAYALRFALDAAAPHTLGVAAVAAPALLGLYGLVYWTWLLRPDERAWLRRRAPLARS